MNAAVGDGRWQKEKIMKNKRNITQVLLGLFLIATIGVNFAVATYPGAEQLKKYQFIMGNEHGDLMVERPLTRAQACVLLAEMHNKKEEAFKFVYVNQTTGGFSDVLSKDWFAPYVGFAKKNDWIAGFPDGSFRPNGYVTSQQWAVMLLSALGYPHSWNTAMKDLAGIDVTIYANDPKKILRGEAFDAMWAVVNKPPYGKTVSLGELMGRLARKEAVIESLEMDNLISLKVKVKGTLTMASAQNPLNYTVTNEEGQSLGIESVTYDEEDGIIQIFFKTAVTQQSSYRFAFNNIVSKDGKPLNQNGKITVTALDQTVPSVLSVTSLGSKAFRVQFSEPVAANLLNTLNNADFTMSSTSTIKSIHLYRHNTEAVVELYTPVNGPLTIQPQSSIKDYFGLGVTSGHFTIDMKKDLTQPTLLAVEQATNTSATLVFDKMLSSAHSSGLYFLVNGKHSDGQAVVKGDTVYITYRKNYMRPGSNRIEVVANAVSDYSGNKNKTISRLVEITADDQAPYLTENIAATEERMIRLIFNEMLDNSEGRVTSPATYQLIDSKGEDCSKFIRLVTYNVEKNIVDIQLSKDIIGTYTLRSKEIKDLAGNYVLIDHSFDISDMKAPDPSHWSAKVYNEGKSNQVLKIRFDEPMMLSGKYSMIDMENYSVKGKQLDKLDVDLLRYEVTDNDTSIEIYYPGTAINGGFNFGSGHVVVARLADKAGNYTKDFAKELPIEKSGYMKVTSAGHTGAKEITLTVHDYISNFDSGDFIIETGTSHYDIEEAVPNYDDSGVTTIVLRTYDMINMPATIRTVRGLSTNKFGESFDNSARINLEDRIGPTVSQINYSGDMMDDVSYDSSTGKVTIAFNEKIDERTVSLLTFTIPGVTIDDIRAYNDEIQMTIAYADRSKINRYDSVIQQVEIRDMAGNSTSNINVVIMRLK